MANRVSRTAPVAKRKSRAKARRAREPVSLKKKIKTLFSLLLLVALAPAAIALIWGVLVFWKFTRELPTLENAVVEMRPPVPTKIVSYDGVVLGTLRVENRQPIPLKEIPKLMQDATISIEDHRFREHSGIDMQGVARAVFVNLRGGKATQGASTLTQQLVRNIKEFGVTRERSVSRKLREAMVSMRLEQIYTKDEILELYLNNIYYGNGAYGVQAAAKTYFGRPVSQLDAAECALLAGIPQRPTYFSPYERKTAVLKRRDEVLAKMREYLVLDQVAYEKALDEKPKIMKREDVKQGNFKAPYFVSYVLNDLNRRYGSDYVRSGLTIRTTLSWKMQQMAEDAFKNGLLHAGELGADANQGAIVSLDNKTGYIRALIGGRSFVDSQYNNATQGLHQPGSTFKAFDYAAAFDTGKSSLYDSFEDKPIPYPGDTKHRIVRNFSFSYSYSQVSCLDAIRNSTNTIAVQVAAKVGIRTVIKYAHNMGIRSKLQPYLPTALGASEVHPLDLASAYSVFPMNGSRCLPMAIVSITDADGNVFEENYPKIRENLLKGKTVEQMNTALEAVVTSGSGTKARGDSSNGIVEGAHGKTGTTSAAKDAWFAGYTPELTTVIWVAKVVRIHNKKTGFVQELTRTMDGAAGGKLCAPIWHDYMIKAVPVERDFRLPTDLPPPQKVTEEGEKKAVEEEKKPRRRRHQTTDETPAGADTPADSNNSPADENTPPTEGTDGANMDNGDNGDSGTDTAPPNGKTDKKSEPETSAPATSPPDDKPPVNDTPPPTRREEKKPPPETRRRTSEPDAPKRVATEEKVTVTVCSDTGKIANEYCPETHTIEVTARERRRLGRCRKHKAEQ